MRPLVLLVLAGCAAPGPLITTESEFDRLLAEVRGFDSAATRTAAARDHYLLAERAFAEGDRDAAELRCEKALQLDPDNAGARALYVQLNVNAPTIAATHITCLRNAGALGSARILLACDQYLECATRAFNAGDYPAAIDGARAVIEYAKWLPPSADLDARRDHAQRMLALSELRRVEGLDRIRR